MLMGFGTLTKLTVKYVHCVVTHCFPFHVLKKIHTFCTMFPAPAPASLIVGCNKTPEKQNENDEGNKCWGRDWLTHYSY